MRDIEERKKPFRRILVSNLYFRDFFSFFFSRFLRHNSFAKRKKLQYAKR